MHAARDAYPTLRIDCLGGFVVLLEVTCEATRIEDRQEKKGEESDNER